jgi:tripartite-type tricarboxylate transporter receptor subunit TctC
VVELGSTKEAKDILTFYASGSAVGRSIFAPPGVPSDRVQMLRKAFDAMLKDPEFLAEIDKLEVEFDPASGEEMQKLISDVANVSPDTVKRMQDILQVK